MQAGADESHYYSLRYKRASDGDEGGFRTLEVKVPGEGYGLVYPKGRFAQSFVPSSQAAAAPDKLDAEFASVLRPGQPPATEIFFNARARQAAQQPNSGSVRYVLNYRVRLDAPSSSQKGRLIFAAGWLGANEASYNQVRSVWRPLDLDLSPNGRAKLSTDGVGMQMNVDVPEGASVLVLGIYDPEAHRMGTVDVPLRIAESKSQ